MENNGTVTLSLKEYNDLYELKRLWDKGGCIFDSYSHYNSRYLYFDKDEIIKKIAEEMKQMQDNLDVDERRLVEYSHEINLLATEIGALKKEKTELETQLKNEQIANGKLIFESKQKPKRWLF